PDRIMMYGVPYKKSQTATVRILGKPGKTLKVDSVASASNVVTIVSVTPYTEPNPNPKLKRTGVSVDVKIPETQPIGSFADEIVVKTRNPKKPEVRVGVMGEVVGRIQYNPKTLVFGPSQGPQTITLNVSEHPENFNVYNVGSAAHLVRPFFYKTKG